jgi:hypothetical protein
MQLKSFQLCGAEHAPKNVVEGFISPQGKCPLNPHGGLLAEAYVHGLNGVTESVDRLFCRAEGYKSANHLSVWWQVAGLGLGLAAR